jgi:hypothetical protein
MTEDEAYWSGFEAALELLGTHRADQRRYNREVELYKKDG